MNVKNNFNSQNKKQLFPFVFYFYGCVHDCIQWLGRNKFDKNANKYVQNVIVK